MRARAAPLPQCGRRLRYMPARQTPRGSSGACVAALGRDEQREREEVADSLLGSRPGAYNRLGGRPPLRRTCRYAARQRLEPG